MPPSKLTPPRRQSEKQNGKSETGIDPKLRDMVGKKRTVDKIETAGSVECKMKRRKMVSCNSRRRTKRCISSIPEEMVFNILLCLPADVINDVMRYVCREWYNIICSPTFISSHLQKQTVGLLLHNYCRPMPGYFVNMRKCELEVKKLKFRFAGTVVASCNGLVLTIDAWRRYNSYVANPVLNQQLALPPSSRLLSFKHYTFAYAATSRVYKVVDCRGFKYEFFILTVGLDEAWRPLDMSQLTSCVTCDVFSSPPVSLGGFVYWAKYEVPYVVSLDVETETFRQIPLPQGCENGLSFSLLAMGCSLSFMLMREEYLWEVWLLMDPKTGQWAKLLDVNLQSQKQFIEDLYKTWTKTWPFPFGWLQSGELLMFHITYPATNIVYNVKTGKICAIFEVNCRFQHLHFSHAHVNSLVPLH